MISKTIWLFYGLVMAGASIVYAAESKPMDDQPNVILIVADDLGWNCVGYHNDEFKTPHIDSIAAEGIELNRFYVAPMCSPTRAGLMTGRYPIRFGMARSVIPPYRDFGLPTTETTLPEMLGKLGYEHRGIFGKWHLGHRRAKWHPLAQGFTDFHGHYNGAIDYFQLTRDDVRDWHVDYEPSAEQGYATDLVAAAAADWIGRSAQSDSPYFCYVSFSAPHSPFQAPQDAIEKYSNPLNIQNRQAKDREIYKAMVGRMDEGIGRILDAVQASGEAGNTLVWFISDNGGVSGLAGLNAPLRGAKLTVFEGGIRVPACVRWPAEINSGRSSDALCGYIDVLPTLVALAGGNTIQLASQPIDGVDLTPILTGATETLANRPWFTYHGQSGEQSEHLAVIDNDWKLLVNGPRLKSVDEMSDGSSSVQLFHLSKDPLETEDVKEQHSAVVAALGQKLVEHRALQPKRSIPKYSVGNEGFVPPPEWKLDPAFPDKLLGHSEGSRR